MHSLYIKDHVTAANSGGKTNTLFVGNVDYYPNMPPRDIDAYLRELLGPMGEVVTISVSAREDLEGEETNGEVLAAEKEGALLSKMTSRPSRFAHVQFAKSSAVKSVLQAAKNGWFAESARQICKRWSLDSLLRAKTPSELRGLFPFVDTDRVVLKRRVDGFMAEFEEGEQLVKAQREKRSREADEEGFMPVQHRKKRKRQSGGREGGSGSTSAVGRARPNKKKNTLVAAAIGSTIGTGKGTGTGTDRGNTAAADVSNIAEQNSEKTLKNFYGFQQREEKQTSLLRLRQQFEEDKAKVARLKAQRKFKPF